MNTGELKFNNGHGALLCGNCRTIILYGYPRADFYHCKKCKETVQNPDPLGKWKEFLTT